MGVGRPLSFDKAHALEQILHVFWRSGYHAASYKSLCSVTGLTKPSLYGTFGNKEETFLAALQSYLDRFVRPSLSVLTSELDQREAIRSFLMATVCALTCESTPPGCMIATNIACAAHAPGIPPRIGNALAKASKEAPEAIRLRLMAPPSPQLTHCVDTSSVALFFEMVLSGLSNLARQGASLCELRLLVNQVMQGYEHICLSGSA